MLLENENIDFTHHYLSKFKHVYSEQFLKSFHNFILLVSCDIKVGVAPGMGWERMGGWRP